MRYRLAAAIAIFVAILPVLLTLCSCGAATAPPDMSSDMRFVSHGPCEGWGCSKDADCLPTLCIDATKHGRCESGTCSWRTP